MANSADSGRARLSAGESGSDRSGGARRSGGAARRSRSALLAGFLLVGAAASGTEPPVQQVLLLHSFDRGMLVLDRFTNDFRASLDRSASRPLNLVQVVVSPSEFVGASEQAVVDYIGAIFTDRPAPDLIVTVAGPAAAFARRHRPELFPGTPLLFASVDERWLRGAPLGEDESAVAVANDFPRLVDEILRLLPDTRQIFMVIGSGPIGRFWRGELEPAFARFHDRLTFTWSDEMTLPEVLRRCAGLPAHSAIVYLSFGTDRQGGAYGDEQVLAGLHATANAPMFAALSPLLGHGIVGGTMVPIGDLGRNTAEVAARILNGERAGGLRIPLLSMSQPQFDWRELERWGIPESRLPAGSVVSYRRPSVWNEHKLAVSGVIGALILQASLIARLLIERRARRRAEIDSRRNLSLAADANRRETMSALTTSIGHELGQPLSAIAQNARALQMMVAADQAAPDATVEIVADIQAEAALATKIIERHRTMLRSRQLQKRPIDLHSVIGESLALVAHDLRARQIETTLDLAAAPCVLDGDPVLLQQVLINLVKNAIDAVADSPAARRRITVRSAVRAAEVEVSVSDTGTGLPPRILGTLFTPFVTTKEHGLGVGLTIARSIVVAHGGTIRAHENPDGGATFTVTLPRDVTSERHSPRPGTARSSPGGAPASEADGN